MKVNSQIGPFSIVPEWVILRGLSNRALRLYIILGRFADYNTGIAFPSRETLADRMGCSEKTVDRAVKELVDHECIDAWSDRRYASKRYQVFQVDPRGQVRPDEGTPMSGEGTELSGEGTDLSVREDTDVHLTITNKREPITENQITSEFDDFWSIYPRKVGKQAARKAFDKAVKAVGLVTVMDGARRLATDPNLPSEKFIPHASRWLNEGRWDDDPYPAPVWDVKPTAAQRTASLYDAAVARDEQELITKGIGMGPDFGSGLKGID